MKEELSRFSALVGEAPLARLSASRVCLFGLGGVGGSCFESLVRMGVGEIDVVDADSFEPSNLNRQSLSSLDAVGKAKVDVAVAKAASLSEDCHVIPHKEFFLPNQESDLDWDSFDFVIDAVDTLSAKLAIAKECHARGIPLVSALGCGNRLDPSKLRLVDVFKTSHDPLAKRMRQGLRELGVPHLLVVWSEEEPLTPKNPVEGNGGRHAPASSPFVPPAAGQLLAYACYLSLTEEEPSPDAPGD